MPYSPSSYGYTPLSIADFGGQASVPTFQSIMGSSFPDLATTLNNLAIARRAPVLAEQGREFDVTSGMQRQSLEAQLRALQQQLQEKQAMQSYLQMALNDPFSHYSTVSSLFGGGGGGGSRSYGGGGEPSQTSVRYVGRNMLPVPATNWTGTYWEDPQGNAHFGNPTF